MYNRSKIYKNLLSPRRQKTFSPTVILIFFLAMSLSGHAATIDLLEFMLVLRLSIYQDAAESSSEFMIAEKLGIGAHSLAKLTLE